MNLTSKIILLFFFVTSFFLLVKKGSENIDGLKMPTKGICAHRGAMATHPENTLTAFREAIRLGTHMIEFDVRMTKDKKLIIMHDRTIDRTTDGTGFVNELTLDEIKRLDAGSWKSYRFIGEKVPTFKEALEVMPKNIWLNIHLKGNEELGVATAKTLISVERIHQGIIACGSDVAKRIRKVDQNIMICNMERKENRTEYIEETIENTYPFIQLLKKRDNSNLKNDIIKLKQNNIKVNFYFGDTEEEVEELFTKGINFILTNRLSEMLEVAESIGIERVQYKNN